MRYPLSSICYAPGGEGGTRFRAGRSVKWAGYVTDACPQLSSGRSPLCPYPPPQDDDLVRGLCPATSSSVLTTTARSYTLTFFLLAAEVRARCPSRARRAFPVFALRRSPLWPGARVVTSRAGCARATDSLAVQHGRACLAPLPRPSALCPRRHRCWHPSTSSFFTRRPGPRRRRRCSRPILAPPCPRPTPIDPARPARCCARVTFAPCRKFHPRHRVHVLARTRPAPRRSTTR